MEFMLPKRRDHTRLSRRNSPGQSASRPGNPPARFGRNSPAVAPRAVSTMWRYARIRASVRWPIGWHRM